MCYYGPAPEDIEGLEEERTKGELGWRVGGRHWCVVTY